MTNDFEREPVADALRASLAAHAHEAPRGDLLAERIIHAAPHGAPGSGDGRPRRAWRTWTLPLVAAGSVAAVVGAVVGVQSLHTSAAKPSVPPAHSRTVSHSPAPKTSPVTSPVVPPPAVSNPPPASSSRLHGVRIIDLTFAQGEGWALASAKCLQGNGRCTALLHTSDGTTWKTMPGAVFNVAGVTAGCAVKCVQDIRFANADDGYAFGPSAFFMTTDGGHHWTQEPGRGAVALETLSGNVIRVTTSGPGCPSWCNVGVETAAIGSSTWTPATLPSGVNLGYGVQLARSNNDDAYLLFTGHVAGGAQRATSDLVRSTDNGRTWASVGEPCPQQGAEYDSVALAGGGGDVVSVLCRARTATGRSFVATSSNAGAHFAATAGSVPAPAAQLLTGDPGTVLVAAGDGLARSDDGGADWTSVAGVSGTVSFVGFESNVDGRAVGNDGRTIWTTHDGGVTWAPHTFG